MPTARELLEQADALMRRNRRNDPVVALTPTEILPEYGAPQAASEHAGLTVDERASSGEGHDADWLASLADLPVLTDVVEIEHVSAASLAPTAELPTVEVPTVEVPTVEVPTVEAQPADATEPTTDWSALAEEIRAQVLQRLDLFTDTGLREQLGAHLKPIVDRASAELVDTINRQVGELVRSYVAEAIEREIEAWRDHNG